MVSHSPRTRGIAVALLVLAAYLAAVGALGIGRATGSTAAWWPAAGIGVVAALLAPRRQWPAVFAGLGVALTLANLTAGRSLVLSSALGASDLVETIVVAHLLRRYVGRTMTEVQDVWRLVAVAVAGALPATIGISLAYQQMLGGGFWSTLALTLPAHAAAVVLMAPLVLIPRRTDPAARPTRRPELAAQVTLLVAATLLTFFPADLTLGFAPLPVLVWAAVRFSERVVVIEQAAYATAITLFTQFGLGPFSELGDRSALTTQHAQLYLVCLVLISLPVATAMRQRNDAIDLVTASERTFRRTFTQSRVPVAILRAEPGGLVFVEGNDATLDLLACASARLAGRRVADVLTGAQLEGAARRILANGATGWSGVLGVVGRPRTRLDGTLSPVEDRNGRATFSLHLLDVTGPHEMHERLQAERDYTRAVIDTASSMIVVTTLEGTVIAANPATTRLLGFRENELVGRPLWETLMSGRQRESAVALFSERRFPGTGEARLRAKDGQQLMVVFSTATHRASVDSPVTVVLSATDVTAAREHAGMVNHLLRSARTIAFVGTDLSGRITLFNTGAERLLGLDAEDATGRELTDFLSPAEVDRHVCHHPGDTPFQAVVSQVADDLAPATREWTWHPVGRSPVRVSVTTNPVIDTFGDLIGYLFVASDITDARRSQEILVKALQRERDVVSRLKDLDRAKDDFVSTVSHELRTPMSSIIGAAEMLVDGMFGHLSFEQEQMVEVIARNGDRLAALADDLLALATLDQRGGGLELTAEVDLRSVVEESASAVAGLLASRDLAVTYDLHCSPSLVSGDAGHLERAVTNLLSNAVKFTPDGGTVHVALGTDQSATHATISVSDNGLGIASCDLDRIFARFYRSAAVQERAIQGSGLGLSIVKTIVEGHEGRVEVHSEEGAGTTFTIFVPLLRAPARSRV